MDANENCTQCHVADVTLYVKQLQYQLSTHRLGGNFTRAGTSCAVCHTHQGYLERVETNALTTAASVTDPAPINCRTCHMIHTTYDVDDYAFNKTSPVTFWNLDPTTGEEYTVDFGAAAGNLCASCHQARPLYQRVLDGVVPTLGGPDIEITNFRYGYHYGPQGQVVSGTGAYEFAGSATINGGPTSHGNPEANVRLCATCHMAPGDGVEVGGHTWRVSFHANGSEEQNVAGCNIEACHGGGIDDFSSFGDVPADVLSLLQDIDALLVAKGIKQQISPGYGIHDIEYYAVTGPWSADLAAALANWNMFTWDRSKGLHNPRYAKTVLTNTLEALQAMP